MNLRTNHIDKTVKSHRQSISLFLIFILTIKYILFKKLTTFHYCLLHLSAR